MTLLKQFIKLERMHKAVMSIPVHLCPPAAVDALSAGHGMC